MGVWWPFLVLALSLLASACIEVTLSPDVDSGSSSAQPDPSDAGTWQRCCDDGVITSCVCTAGAICNYLAFTDCGDGTCSTALGDPPYECGASDAGRTDGGGVDAGSWDECCEDGVVTACFCPARAICNYGDFSDCGDGTCSTGAPGQACGGPDAGRSDGGVSDAGTGGGSADAGHWERCCRDGIVSSCFCAANWACNYGWFTDCGDGTCEDFSVGVCGGDGGYGYGDGGYGDGGSDSGGGYGDGGYGDGGYGDGGSDSGGGHWETCCENGLVTTCFCPANWACNYGWFTHCEGGTCVDGVVPLDAGACPPPAEQEAG